MNKRIVLMADGPVGLEVCRYLVARGNQIVRLYLHEPSGQHMADCIVAASGCHPNQVYTAASLKDPEHVVELVDLHPDCIITVYWAHLIRKDVIDAATLTVNFHPALLPINRGWYPHVHSMLDGTPTGVTLHAIDEHADTGPVWAQREVPISPYDNAGTIYRRLQDEIVSLFKKTWPEIASGHCTPKRQDESKAIYHKKSEIDRLDEIDLTQNMSARDLINLLRARTFEDRGWAYYTEAGQRVYLNLRLAPTSNFSEDR